MFAHDLSFYLSLPGKDVGIGVIRAILPDLAWGEESDLMKHSDDWPVAVVRLRERHGYEPDERCDFPVAVEFLHFPGRVAGNDIVMLATKLAILRRLSAIFECRVICDARGFAIQDEPHSGGAYAWVETFLCQSGRVYSGVVPDYDARDGARPADGWIALDDLVEIGLNPDGSPHEQERSVARLGDWIEVRDVSRLRGPTHPIFPDPDEEDPVPLTPEEIEAEIAEEFPTEEELDREEAEWTAYADRLDAWNAGGGTTSSKQLIREGISLPSPDSLDDKELPVKLAEVVDGLARVRTYLHRTDHLSDRELYTWLWEEGLNESTVDLSGIETEGSCHTSPIGSGDDESVIIGLTFYDSIEERADWKAQFPEMAIPARRDLPSDRDRFLPRGEEELF